MPSLNYPNLNTKSLVFDIITLRDETFYEFMRAFSEKRVAERLLFQDVLTVYDRLLVYIKKDLFGINEN